MKLNRIIGILAVLVVLLSQPSYAFATFYAYCIDSKAYKPPLTDEVKARPIPGLNPDDAADRAVILSHPFPKGDELCRLNAVSEANPAGEMVQRCQTKQGSVCLHTGQLDLEAMDPHDVPSYAFFKDALSGNDIRCQCGCFSSEMSLLTSRGWVQIGELAALADGKSSQLMLKNAQSREYSLSSPLRKSSFTVGPELKPMYLVKTESGYAVYLTDEHPVLVKQGKFDRVVQAKTLRVGDTLYTAEGTQTRVSAISTHLLESISQDSRVFNVDTQANEMSKHFVAAQGLVVGDVVWQNVLSSRSQREARLSKALEFAKQHRALNSADKR